MHYRLRTLLLLLAILPPLLWIGWWKYSAWQAEQERLKAAREMQVNVNAILTTPKPRLPIQLPKELNYFRRSPEPEAPAKAGELPEAGNVPVRRTNTPGPFAQDPGKGP